jgi:hypothetical protein
MICMKTHHSTAHNKNNATNKLFTLHRMVKFLHEALYNVFNPCHKEARKTVDVST